MDAQDVLDDIQGLSRETSKGLVIHDKDGDGIAAVDLLSELGLGEILFEGAELREAAEEPGDVEGRGGGGEQKEESKGKGERGLGIHV